MAHIVIEDQKISNVERRTLANIPKFELTSNYISDFEDYLLDHFPLRDSFRSIKANFNYKVLNKLDNNQIFLNKNYIFKSEYPTNDKSIQNFKKHIDNISKLFKNNNAFLLIVPDKNYYLDTKNFLHIDYDYLYKEMAELSVDNIDIRQIMNLADYYETDTHWRQEKILKVVDNIAKVFNLPKDNSQYTQEGPYDFYGVYSKEAALNRQPDKLYYLTNDILKDCQATYLENTRLNSVYNLEKLSSLDAYEVYLDGASAYIEIINDRSLTNRELIIFRDSFGSSITPLLIPYYSKITVIDNRYISSLNYLEYIDFNTQDVLFVYSTLIINNSFSLKG